MPLQGRLSIEHLCQLVVVSRRGLDCVLPVIRQRSANTGRHSAINLAVHIHAAASQGVSLQLAVFDARFYIGVRCVDEPG
jgi:hypothetical protein